MPSGPPSVPILSSTYLKVRLRNMGPSVEPSDTKQDHIATAFHLDLRRPRLLRILMGICAVLARAVLAVAAGYTSGVSGSVRGHLTQNKTPRDGLSTSRPASAFLRHQHKIRLSPGLPSNESSHPKTRPHRCVVFRDRDRTHSHCRYLISPHHPSVDGQRLVLN